jgi:hypothetical protein
MGQKAHASSSIAQNEEKGSLQTSLVMPGRLQCGPYITDGFHVPTRLLVVDDDPPGLLALLEALQQRLNDTVIDTVLSLALRSPCSETITTMQCSPTTA